MKTFRPEAFQLLAIAAASVLGLRPCAASAPAGATAADAGYPSVILTEMGAAEFAPGDSIAITSVRGDREHLVPGGRYVLYGSYTLASAETADLAWYATSRGGAGTTRIADSEHLIVSKGSGTFRLEKTLLGDGWLHLQFSIDGHAHGGVYFGEKGIEATVLRRKGWSDFSGDAQGGKAAQNSAGDQSRAPSVPVAGNFAIMAYLGEPVPAPAGLDPRYSPAGLRSAFADLGQRLRLTVDRLEVDDSEFPFAIYGLIAGRCDYHALADGVNAMDGYAYGGSVTGDTREGATYFAISITPDRLFPQGRVMDCSRRLMVRLQMLADIMRSGATRPAPRVEILFDKPEGYTDRMLSYGPDWFHEAVFSTLQNFLVKLGDQLLPAGYSLKITFTDIDIGGRDSAKVPASSGLPAFEFTYEVKDGAGTVVKQGAEKLRNYTDFENQLLSIPTADTAGMKLRFEKAMLKSWLTRTVEDLKKG
jgi:hypothetical protein